MPSPAFEFASPGRVIFGAGSLAKVEGVLDSLKASRPLLVTGKSDRFVDRLPKGGAMIRFVVPTEPTVDTIREGRALAIRERCDAVVALGGGSAIDAGKAIAGLAGNEGDVLDYLEIVGRALPLPRPGLPCIAIPTTAGTGAEVTKNSVLTSPEDQVKASLRSPYLLPAFAIVDPDLLWLMPKPVLAATAMDALSHLVESFVSTKANPLTIALAREGIDRSRDGLVRVTRHGLDSDACADLALASLLGGFCLANSGLGAVHGFAAPLGGRWKAPHGVVCAALLPKVMAANVLALRTRAPESPCLERFTDLDGLFDGNAADWVSAMVATLGIPSLGALGIGRSDIPALVTKAKAASSMRGNPIELTEEELSGIADAAIGV